MYFILILGEGVIIFSFPIFSFFGTFNVHISYVHDVLLSMTFQN